MKSRQEEILKRADRAEEALLAYVGEHGEAELPEAVVDLLTDLHHYCYCKVFDFDNALKESISNFRVESGKPYYMHWITLKY